jgi:hypothetical protein
MASANPLDFFICVPSVPHLWPYEFFGLSRVNALAAEGVAPANPLDRLPPPRHRAVFVDRVDGVLTARWMKAAASPRQRAEHHAVEQNQLN